MTLREALGYLRPAYVRGAVSDAVDAMRWSARGARLGAAAEHRFLHQPFKVTPAPTQLYPLVATPDLRGSQGGEAIASLADQLMREGFAVLGSMVMLDSPLPWHEEWTAGFRYPRMPTRLLSRRIRFSPGYDQGHAVAGNFGLVGITFLITTLGLGVAGSAWHLRQRRHLGLVRSDRDMVLVLVCLGTVIRALRYVAGGDGYSDMGLYALCGLFAACLPARTVMDA